MECPSCGAGNAAGAERCGACRELLDADAWEDARAGYSGMIPSRNGPALAAYYLGIFAFIPFLGILLGAAAFFLGLAGRKRAHAMPEVKGLAHAWIGIVLGGFFAALYVVMVVFIWLA